MTSCEPRGAPYGGHLFSLRFQSVCKPTSPLPPASMAASELTAAQYVSATVTVTSGNDNREKSSLSKQ